jgi:hypothetical protein
MSFHSEGGRKNDQGEADEMTEHRVGAREESLAAQ